MRNYLLLAGLDPSSAAGLLRDAFTIKKLGGHPFCLPTALTVQTLDRAYRSFPIQSQYIKESVRKLLQAHKIAGIKIGMLHTKEQSSAITSLLRENKNIPAVWDPVLFASSGKQLFQRGALPSFRAFLSEVDIVTPNSREAHLLLHPLPPQKKSQQIVKELAEKTKGCCILTGGDLPKPLNLFYDCKQSLLRVHRYKKKPSVRGTGCAFSTTLLFYLSQDNDNYESYKKAFAFVRKEMIKARKINATAIFP